MIRFAPSPTGDMHIGNLRAAILNFIVAKQRGEKFLIRIEDTDKARNIDGADKEILAILNLFGLFWDKLVYQSDNFKIHNELALQLVKKGEAFYCYATKEFLDNKRNEALTQKKAFRYDDTWALLCKDKNPNPVIRLKCGNSSLTQSSQGLEKSAFDRQQILSQADFPTQPTNLTQDTKIANTQESISFIDEIKGECTFSQNEIDSFVIIRDDKIPTYNFACAVDDMIYDISFIIRGEDHTSNTPKQMLVHKKLGYTRHIKYAHLPIILNDEGKKMSKRESESSVKWLIAQGFLPKAILNYLLLMGNNPPTEIFTLEDAIKWFDLSQLSKSPVRFDINQLRHINREHLKRLSEYEMGMLIRDSSAILSQIMADLSPYCHSLQSEESKNNSNSSLQGSEATIQNICHTETKTKVSHSLESKRVSSLSAKAQNDKKKVAQNDKKKVDYNDKMDCHENPNGFSRNDGMDSVCYKPKDSRNDDGDISLLLNMTKNSTHPLSPSCYGRGKSNVKLSARDVASVELSSARESMKLSHTRESLESSISALGHIFLEESSTLNEIRTKIERIFAPKVINDDFSSFSTEIALIKSAMLDLIEKDDESLNDFNMLKAKLSNSCKILDKPLKGKALFMPLRFLLTGSANGPHLDILYPHLRVHLPIILRFDEE